MAQNQPLTFDQLSNLEAPSGFSLASNKLIDVSTSFNSSMGKSIQFVFSARSGEETSIFIEEVRPGGRLQNSSESDLDELEDELNSCLYVLWLALAPAKRAQEYIKDDHSLSRIVEGLSYDLQKLAEEQQRRLRARSQLAQELKTESFKGVFVLPGPTLADGIALPPLDLPDQLDFKVNRVKVEKKSKGFTQREIENFAHLPRAFYASVEQTHENIFYFFSDGKIIGAHDILSHHYCLLVPPDLLPGGKLVFPHALLKNVEVEPEPWKHLFSRMSLKANIGTSDEEIIRGIFDAAALRLEKQQMRFALLEDEDSSRYFEIKKIEFSAAMVLKWQMKFLEETSLSEMKVELKLESTDHRTKRIALTHGLLDLESRAFIFRSLVDEINWFKNLARRPYDHELLDDHGVQFDVRCLPTYEPRFFIEGASRILEIRAKLRTSVHYYPFEEQNSKTVRATPEIHVRKDGRFTLLRRIDESGIYVGGLSKLAQDLLMHLSSEGFQNFFDDDSILGQKSKYRDFETKLMRHQGVLNLLIFESLHFRFRQSLSDGVKIDSTKSILESLQSKILSLLGISRLQENMPTLRELCSEECYAKLESVVETYYKAPDEKFYSVTPQGEIELVSFVEQELRFFFAVLEDAAITSRGELFARTRVNLFERINPEKNEKFEISLSYSRPVFSDTYKTSYFQPAYSDFRSTFLQTLAIAQSLLPNGFEIFYENTRLNELSEKEFTTNFELSEQSAVPGTSGAQAFDWFELNPRFFLGGEEIQQSSAGQLIEGGMIEHKGQYYLVPVSKMPSLRRLANFWERLRQGKNIKSPGSKESTYLQVPKSQILEMLALRAEGIQFQGGKRWQEICDFYDGLSQGERELEVSPQFNGELKNYQKIGVRRLYDLYRLGLGAILADDMGLGKTIQVLAFLALLRDEKRVGNVLIVVPTSLSYNWMSERAKFVPDLEFFEFSPRSRESMLDFVQANKPAVVVTTYGLLHEHRAFFEQTKWDIAIFDEAQNLKNISAQRTTAARALPAKIKMCLTGTPLENHLGELYSLLDLAVPGSLGDRDEFRKVYVNPSTILREDLDFLKLKTRPLILRRTKNEILSELPAKQESKVLLTFEKRQKEIYRDIAISYNDKIQQAIATTGESKVQLQMLTALLRLRQVCSDPGALPGVTYNKTPPKIESLLESLTEIVESGESVLVFTQFLHTLSHIEKVLTESAEMKGAPVYVLQGTLNRKQREDVLRGFNETKGGAVLLMTLKTGGVGLNLTKASYVFHIEPWWNPAVENQATDRAHRIGQKRAVQVYRYIMHESVEEKIELLKAQKKLRFDAMFSETEDLNLANGGNHLSREDFNFLLSGN